MAAAITIDRVSNDGETFHFNVTLTGNYPAGGETLDFTKASYDPSFIGVAGPLPITSLPPIHISIEPNGGSSAATMLANQLVAVLGATLATCKLVISAASSFGTEFTAGAYSAGLLAMKISGYVTISKMI